MNMRTLESISFDKKQVNIVIILFIFLINVYCVATTLWSIKG